MIPLLHNVTSSTLDTPPFPWHTVVSDLFYHRKQDYLVLVDYFSKFLIVRKLPYFTSGAIIKELGLIFSEYGRPCIFRSDNGPCYASQFKHFLFSKNWTYNIGPPANIIHKEMDSRNQ